MPMRVSWSALWVLELQWIPRRVSSIQVTKIAPWEDPKTSKAHRSDYSYKRFINGWVRLRDCICFRHSIVSIFGNQLVQLHIFENILYLSMCVHAPITWHHISICSRQFTRIANSKKQIIEWFFLTCSQIRSQYRNHGCKYLWTSFHMLPIYLDQAPQY